jgi:hypothetical protein
MEEVRGEAILGRCGHFRKKWRCQCAYDICWTCKIDRLNLKWWANLVPTQKTERESLSNYETTAYHERLHGEIERLYGKLANAVMVSSPEEVLCVPWHRAVSGDCTDLEQFCRANVPQVINEPDETLKKDKCIAIAKNLLVGFEERFKVHDKFDTDVKSRIRTWHPGVRQLEPFTKEMNMEALAKAARGLLSEMTKYHFVERDLGWTDYVVWGERGSVTIR